MKWLRRIIRNWLNDERPVQVSGWDSPYPSDSSRQLSFGLIEAENGQVMKAYDPSTDKMKYWIINDGNTIGQMVDTYLVTRKL